MTRIFVLICGLTMLTACNTVDGLGQDISSVARAVDNAL
jgi:predicted small secreted protein